MSHLVHTLYYIGLLYTLVPGEAAQPGVTGMAGIPHILLSLSWGSSSLSSIYCVYSICGVWVCTCKVCVYERVCCAYEQQTLDSILTWTTHYMVNTSVLTATQCLLHHTGTHAHISHSDIACEVAIQRIRGSSKALCLNSHPSSGPLERHMSMEQPLLGASVLLQWVLQGWLYYRAVLY